MFAHLLKLVWKRKTRNLMLTLEILLAFLMVFAIAAAAVRFTQLYRMPLGMEYENVWAVNVQGSGGEQKIAGALGIDELERAVRGMPQVQAVGFMSFSPFTFSSMTDDIGHADGSGLVGTESIYVTDETPKVLGLRVTEGRWFSRADEGLATPAVINRRLADALFPGRSALGQRLSSGGKKPVYYTVTGVMEDMRTRGNFMAPSNYMVTRFAPGGPDDLRTLVVRLAPGTPRAFEQQLVARLRQMRPNYGFTVTPLTEERDSMLRSVTIPLTVASVIAAFLLVMVGVGLFGVLWQNTTLRIPEIGLRRAVGASPGAVYSQIVWEQLLLSSLALVTGLVLLAQLPLTGALGDSLNWSVFAAAGVLSAGVIYLISLLCALYPGWRASRLSPTEALHYE
ncbi:FtsX-like permease family protein [Massilia arenosa]|uniref:FtsX-like permease family protein n=1 Tax=Zemynaea arenosa TaxID=2561931 RepID=A0A4Y9RVX3_9BURK|nr:ABC transporter permease [Massilia arenosa]TFW11448.1 FtsX-like permease family protein [Massilia arenosa]